MPVFTKKSIRSHLLALLTVGLAAGGVACGGTPANIADASADALHGLGGRQSADAPQSDSGSVQDVDGSVLHQDAGALQGADGSLLQPDTSSGRDSDGAIPRTDSGDARSDSGRTSDPDTSAQNADGSVARADGLIPDTGSPAQDLGVPFPGTSGVIGYSSCPAPAGTGATYTIGLLDGSGQPTGPQTIADFAHWNELKGGDVVCIYGRTTPYAERLILNRSGSDDQHRIRIVGVVQGGNEPILSGKSATTAAAFNYGSSVSTYYSDGEVSITGPSYGVPVAYLNIEGLTIQDATTADISGTAANPTYSVNTFTDPNLNGNSQSAWRCGNSGINLIRCDHVSIIHNRIRNNDNGIFVNSNNGETSSNITVGYNYIYGNGLFGERSGPWNPGHCTLDAHGVYSEASNISYIGNRFGPTKLGQPTNLLKDRSSGLVVAFNLFASDGTYEASLGDTGLVGASPQPLGHILDLVESYDGSVGLNTLGAVYDNVSVYGNIFFADSAGLNANQGTTAPLHFGGDQGNPTSYRRQLHFYNNTVVARRDSSSTDGVFGWFEMETNTNVEAWNNIFYASANQTSTPQTFNLLNGYCYAKPCGTATYLAQNWNSPLWGTAGVNGSATSPNFVNLAKYDVHIATADPTIVGNGQVGNPSFPANATTVPIEYVDFLSTAARTFSKSKIDLGALGYSGR